MHSNMGSKIPYFGHSDTSQLGYWKGDWVISEYYKQSPKSIPMLGSYIDRVRLNYYENSSLARIWTRVLPVRSRWHSNVPPCFLNCPLKILLFPNRTGFHHFNTRSVRYSTLTNQCPNYKIMKIPDVACTASCIEKINLIKFENKKIYRWRPTTAKDGEGFAKKILFFLQASQLTIFHLLNHASIPRNIIRFEMKQDRFTACFKICGTSPLILRAGERVQSP